MKKTIFSFLVIASLLGATACTQSGESSTVNNSGSQEAQTVQIEKQSLQANTAQVSNEMTQDQTQETNDETFDEQQPLSPELQNQIKTDEIKEEDKTKKYSVDVYYPELIALGNKDVQGKINGEIKNAASAIITKFKKEVDDWKLSADLSNVAADESYTGLTFTVPLLNGKILSVLFYNEENFRGSAHPNSFFSVANYNLENGQPISYADLFKKDTNYLKIISDYCIKDLQDQLKKEYATESDSPNSDLTADDIQAIKDGAGPTKDNLKNFTLNSNELTIYFDAYQVAPYAMGPQQVHIPYQKIQDSLDPNGLLKDFIGK